MCIRDRTAGVDGQVVLLSSVKAEMADWVQRHTGPWQASPVKRVYIPKRGSKGKRRPLGIPVILDRVLQARVVNALEPEWEARFEPRSYGCLLYTSPSPRDRTRSRMPSSA